MSVELSCIVPTFNRPALVRRLLGTLRDQTLAPQAFEVLVVDDGSTPPVGPALREERPPFALEVVEQPNAGPGAARHAGALRARGEVLVFIDDDMQVGPGFLEEHRRRHQGGRATVMGRIMRDPTLGKAPLFERFRHDVIDRQLARAEAGEQLRGTRLCTGNFSVRKADYLAVGGFDPSLRISEDSELGLRLEEAGVPVTYAPAAVAVHGCDHSDSHWHETAHRYPSYDLAVARKHPGLAYADPWRYLFTLPLPARPILAASVLFPRTARTGSHATMATAELADIVGLTRVALRLTAIAYGMEYFSGMRDACGSLPAAARSCLAYLRKDGALR